MWEIKLKVTNEEENQTKLANSDNQPHGGHQRERGWEVGKGKGGQKYGDGR